MASKKRRALYKKAGAKRIERLSAERQYQQLYNDVLKESKKVNARLESLSRRYKKGTWASKKLFRRLDSEVLKAITKEGRVKVDKNLTTIQYLTIDKAMKQFLRSKTSTKKGIREVKRETIKSLKETMSIDEEEFSDEDAEFAYEMLGDNDFDFFNHKIGASTMWAIIEDAIDMRDSQNAFINRLNLYITLEDIDVRKKAIRLYDKFVL